MRLGGITSAPGALGDCDCAKDPIACLKKLFVDIVQKGRIEAGQEPARRPVFLRLHGTARGIFTIRPDLPDEFRIGLFRGNRYDAWVRFSSDLPSGSDLLSTVGIGIKLFDVPGEKVFPAGSCATTHDFIFQNHDVFFVRNAIEMCQFTYSALIQNDLDGYLNAHPETAKVLKDMEKEVPSVLATDYWAILPFQFGKSHAKYKLVPITVPGTSVKASAGIDPFYMHADLRDRLAEGPARMQFAVQLRRDPGNMPLDDAMARWNEQVSQFVPVADLELFRQNVDDRGTATYGENLAFNIWHALPEHAPVGSLAVARKVVYAASAELRLDVNGIPRGEPEKPRPLGPWPAPKDRLVVKARIHPAIGIARVGNSSEFLYAPEVPDPKPLNPGSYHDSTGALKRQACRFRIYGYNAADEVVAELTADNAEISWTTHVANKKAAWYRFPMALDVPEAANARAERRNKDVTGTDRAKLVLDAGKVTLGGRNMKMVRLEASAAFGSAPFKVCLGEMKTDGDGLLVFVAGYGDSRSPLGKPVWDGTASGFPNADGWYDDICDGPVSASVCIDGRNVPVESAWVVTAPPNYAPDILGVRTLYDLMADLYIRSRWMEPVQQVSFSTDVYPILSRLSRLQWVNAGFAAEFGWSGRHDFTDPSYLKILCSKSSQWAEHRRQVLNSFRNPDAEDNNSRPWPWLYGDAMDIPPAKTPRQNCSLSGTQYRILQHWADGNFVEDWGTNTPPRMLSEVPLATQPKVLDRASLEFCLADAFHPGIELTWPMRHLSIYEKPFRIRRRASGSAEPDYGDELTSEGVMRVDGPLHEQGPGDLTRWLGLPWQMDTAMCRAGYEPEYDPFLPSFWPARVPNDVLTQESYDAAENQQSSVEERTTKFLKRERWVHALQGGTPLAAMTDMVSRFSRMGVLEWRTANPPFPRDVWIVPQAVERKKEKIVTKEAPPPENISRAGWNSEAQLNEFRAVIRATADRKGKDH